MIATELAARRAREALLVQLTEFDNLPAMAGSVSQVVRLASSEENSVQSLAAFLLNDVALTQKILRLSNTVVYRGTGGPVSTVSRAIAVLGFETIKTNALAMLLVEGLKGRKGKSVRTELGLALSASVVGREMAKRSHYKDAEEAAISSLFKNVGRLLVAAYDDNLYAKIALLCETEQITPRQASVQVLGGSFETIADNLLRAWDIPKQIIYALAPLHASVLRTPKNRAEWMQQVATFSASMAAALPTMTQPGYDAPSVTLLERFGVALELDASSLAALAAAVIAEIGALAEEARPAFGDTDEVVADAPSQEPASADAALPAEESPLADFIIPTEQEEVAEQRYTSGKPVNARDRLAAGIATLSEAIATGQCPLNQIIQIALKVLYESMGYRYATVCMREVNTGLYKSRVALGSAAPQLPANFAFAAEGRNDLFFLAMHNNADLLISDASSPKVTALLPAWHREMFAGTRSFIVLPLVVRGVPLGYFYADRIVEDREGVSPEEGTLLKMIKNQVVGLMKSR